LDVQAHPVSWQVIASFLKQ